uniref:SKA complex subunit 1 n=2 Tax=Denticeps clupeoides TaxID=299321 RepID=A0AAY4A5A8_9TELE
MSHCELEKLTTHVNSKLSANRTVLELRSIAKDSDKRKILQKIGQDIREIDELLDQFQKNVATQRDMLKHLKDLDDFFQEAVQDGKHMKVNVPSHMPRRGQPVAQSSVVPGQAESQAPVQEQEAPKKPQARKHIKELTYVTVQEFEGVPPYMKGRVTYDQLNGAVESINKAVTGKYKILHQPTKSLNNASRRLHQRFKDQETKDTRGQFFIVEADIQEFSKTKVDKRFVGMLNMLRHCQRLKELRGGGLTRYL